LQEKYLRASTELGKAKEFELKDKLEGKLGVKLRNYSKDGIEFDLVGRKNKTSYLVEVKWRNRPTDYKEVRKFLDKVGRSEFSGKRKKLFFISKASFTYKAIKLAEKNNIKTEVYG